MKLQALYGGLLMALVMPSVALSRTWSSAALQHAYFAEVAQISRGIVQPFKDKNGPGFDDENAIFEVDLDGNGSKYIVSYGKAKVDIRSLPPGVKISPYPEGKSVKFIKKDYLVILILNERSRELTIMPIYEYSGSLEYLRPLRIKGAKKYIPDDAKDCLKDLPKDRDAISIGDSGGNRLIYRFKRWTLRGCPIE